MSVKQYKRKDGKCWKAEVWIKGKRVKQKKGFRTKYEAQRWKSEFTAQYHADPDQFGLKESLRMDDLFARYKRDHLLTLRSETQRRYQLDLRKRIEPYFLEVKICNLTSGMIDAFRSKLLRKTKLSKASINKCCDLLGSILKKGEEWDFMSRSPYKLKRLKVDSSRYEWWDDKAQIRKFLDVIQGTPYEAAFRLGLECGMRLGEIVGLSKRDISFDFGTIQIHRQWIDKDKSYGPTKHNQVRTVGFKPDSELGKCLRRAVLASNHLEAIFVTKTGRRVGSRNLAAPRFQNLVEKAGLPRICFHGLRHTFASWYMIQFGDIWSLMQILGHNSIKTTMRYAHVSSKHQKVPEFNWEGGEIKPLRFPSQDAVNIK